MPLRRHLGAHDGCMRPPPARRGIFDLRRGPALSFAGQQNENDATQADVASFQKLNLRLFIEQTLRAGEGHELALLQLLEPVGYLRMVGDIVNETINAMNATRQNKGDATKDYLQGQTLMNAGKEKEAFKYFMKSYKTAVE